MLLELKFLALLCIMNKNWGVTELFNVILHCGNANIIASIRQLQYLVHHVGNALLNNKTVINHRKSLWV